MRGRNTAQLDRSGAAARRRARLCPPACDPNAGSGLPPANPLQHAARAPADRARLSFHHAGAPTDAARAFADTRCVRRRFVSGVLRFLGFLHGQCPPVSGRGSSALPSWSGAAISGPRRGWCVSTVSPRDGGVCRQLGPARKEGPYENTAFRIWQRQGDCDARIKSICIVRKQIFSKANTEPALQVVVPIRTNGVIDKARSSILRIAQDGISIAQPTNDARPHPTSRAAETITVSPQDACLRRVINTSYA